MSKILYFYATKSDILAVTGDIESNRPIKYVRFGHVASWPPKAISSAADIPRLGMASRPSAAACDKFLVLDAETAIEGRQLKTHSEADAAKSPRYAVDQLKNPDSISFSAGGTWEDGTLLHGAIGTASQSRRSSSLMKEFESRIKRQFSKVKAFYVGLEALELLKNGKRLTIAVQSPPEFDLRYE